MNSKKDQICDGQSSENIQQADENVAGNNSGNNEISQNSAGNSWSWSQLDTLVQNAVVQVFAQVAAFDWVQPYRIESQYESRGTGFFINDQGYFVTNAHVVMDARSIWIHIPVLGRVPLPVKVIGICPEIDVALLCLQEESLAFVRKNKGPILFFECADSHDIKPTTRVLALGYPLGQNHIKSMTGVISGREFFEGRSFLQTTAPLNPGNSGGPLVGTDGKVLGIMVSGVLTAQGVGYAIPINDFILIFDKLMKGGLVYLPRLGISLSSANDEKAAFFNNPEPAGVYIVDVLPGSLCDIAGVHEGDMWYELNGYSIDAYGESTMSSHFGRATIHDIVASLKIDQEISMVIYRQGVRIEFSFLYSVQAPLPIRTFYPGYEPIDYEIMGGLVLMPLSDNHMETFGESAIDMLAYRWPKKRVEGAVVITYVLPGSYAYQMYSFNQGDIIRYVNNKRVHNLESFRSALSLSVATGLISIKTETGVFVVFSLERLLIDENRLSKDFMYPISQTVVRLQRELLSKELNKNLNVKE